MNDLLVMKFGGTSMGSAERIRVAASICAGQMRERPVVAVVSAMSKITDLLLEVDERKPGIHREVRYEITPSELIAAIRANGAALPGKPHNDGPIPDPM